MIHRNGIKIDPIILFVICIHLEPCMKTYSALNWLIPAIVILSLITAGVALFWQPGYDPQPSTNSHGQSYMLAGRGIYAHDTVFTASTTRGTDAVVLAVGLPVLIITFVSYRRRNLRGAILLTGVMAFMLYYGASLALDKAYNNLFLVYIALFSASFFAFILSFNSVDMKFLSTRLSQGIPWQGTGIFMVIVGVGLAVIWLSDVVVNLIANQVPPLLGASTTIVTYSIDAGIIATACVTSGVMLFKHFAMGAYLSAVLNIMLIMVGIMVIGQTIFQLAAGIYLTPGELIGKTVSFVIMAGFAVWFVTRFFSNLSCRDIEANTGKQ